MIMVVDTGVDDALALALAVRHPAIQIDAVVTSWGNVGLDLVNANTLKVLDWLGAGDVPVLSGPSAPFLGEPIDASHWHGRDGLGGATLPPTTRSVSPGGVEAAIARIEAAPGQISLVCTGPLTALALMARGDPRVVDRVKEVVLMGGAAQLPGNTTPVAEFNVYADPEAAAVVFDQTWPLTMVGLDVTNRVTLSADDAAALANLNSSEAVLVREVTRHFFEHLHHPSMALHDPLAVAVAVDPSLVDTVAGPVQVETRGQLTRGQTVVDLRRRVEQRSSSTRVATEVDVARFRALFFKTLRLEGPGS
jgi:inosine-uridine nucleoside N-ribohydrolase